MFIEPATESTSIIFTSNKLTPEHQEHITGRGLELRWAIANCISCTIDAASVALGPDRTAKSPGILLISDRYGQNQFRPDEPWPSKDGKLPKYRTPQGEYDVFLSKHPEIEAYWEDLEALKVRCFTIDGKPYLLITEGGFKAIMGCQHEIPTVALVGVTMGITPKSKGDRDLVPGLKRLAQAGFNFIIAFDSDKKPDTIKNVRVAEKALTEFLKAYGCEVLSVTGQWEPGEGGEIKGMDDFILNKGVEEFRAILLKAQSVTDRPKKKSKKSDSGTDKPDEPPLPQLIGGWFAEDLRERLIYSEQHQSWMAYELNLKGVWTAVGDAYVLNAIESMCRQRNIYPNNNYVSNVLGTLKRILFCLEWTERPSCEMLPFEDGVLQIGTTVFREHAPGDRLTWSLERPYRGSAVRAEGWGAIEQWLSEATEGNARKQQILLAFAAAALRGMSSIQKFLMLTGPGGTGKGVFSHLLTMVLGERNTWIGNLEDLNKPDRIAELQTKRLALFDDQERYMGNLSNFRSLTGGGKISGRQLYKSAINFTFNGLALVTANQPCFPATGISWLKRRIIQEEFRHQPTKRNIHLQKQLAPELSAFTRHLLSIPVADIERILGEEMTGINHTFWEDRIQADPLASWINDQLIHEPGAEMPIGSDKDEWKDGNYDATQSTAFGSYNYICRSGNSIPLSKNKFSANLIELCQGVLGWRDVAKTRKGDARYIVGVRLRTSADTAILPLDQTLNDDDCRHDDNLSDNLKSIQSMAYADVDNLLETFSEKDTTTLDLAEKMELQSNSPNDFPLIEKLGADTANVSTTQSEKGNGSAQQPTLTSSTGSSQLNMELLQDFARRIGEALGYRSQPVADAIFTDVQRSIASKDVTQLGLIEVAGIEVWQAFTALRGLSDEEVALIEMIKQALALNDLEATKAVVVSLKEVCNSGVADRNKVWFDGLTESERAAFNVLAK